MDLRAQSRKNIASYPVTKCLYIIMAGRPAVIFAEVTVLEDTVAAYNYCIFNDLYNLDMYE